MGKKYVYIRAPGRPKKSDKQIDRMLKYYSESGNLTAACAYAKIARQSHYNWLETDPQYAQRFQLAADAACDALVSEARRRGFEGWEEPVGWYKGQAGGTIRRYSDLLLLFLIKGARPEIYREEGRGVSYF